MTAQIFTKDIKEFESLCPDCYTRKLKSDFLAYGTDYDFLRFYKLSSDGDKAVIRMLNSTMLVATFCQAVLSDDDLEDIILFINMNKPSMIEIDYSVAERIKDRLCNEYRCENRTEFEYDGIFESENIVPDPSPSLDDVFEIVRLSFPALADSYELWLTDTSHRIRRSQSILYCLDGSSTLMIKYMLDGYALIGQVGTHPDRRGQHYARKLIYAVNNIMHGRGLKVCLFAREKMVSFYKELGFGPKLEDIVFERKSADEQ